MTPIGVSENGSSFPINMLRHSERAEIGVHCFDKGSFRGGGKSNRRLTAGSDEYSRVKLPNVVVTGQGKIASALRSCIEL